jgi:hypothetical protein
MTICALDTVLTVLTMLLAVLGIPGAVLMMQSRQAWIALDQWVHCLCYDDAMADETFSARCWREAQNPAGDDKHYRKWSRRVRWIDTVFGKGHCLAAFESELNRKQLPPGFYHD